MFKAQLSPLRVLEALIAFGTTYLALNSFFASSIYHFISDMMSWILQGMGFVLESRLDASRYMPILLGVVVFVLIVLEFLSGEEKNTINIFQINLMLFFPEALSFSKLNWYNLLDAGYLLDPRRSFYTVFLTGVVIMTGYCILSFITRFRDQMGEYQRHGVDSEQVKLAIEGQTKLSIYLGLISAVIIIVAALIVNFVSNLVSPFAFLVPYPYLVFGVTATIGIILWVTFVLNKNTALRASIHTRTNRQDYNARAVLAHPFGLPMSWPWLGWVKEADFKRIEVANSAQFPYKLICNLNKRLAEKMGNP